MSSPPRPTTNVEEPDAPDEPRTITRADRRSWRSIAARTGSRSRRRLPPGYASSTNSPSATGMPSSIARVRM